MFDRDYSKRESSYLPERKDRGWSRGQHEMLAKHPNLVIY